MGLIILDDDDEDSPETTSPRQVCGVKFPSGIAGLNAAIDYLEQQRKALNPQPDDGP